MVNVFAFLLQFAQLMPLQGQKMRNTKQFNGVCGCDWCFHAGMYKTN